jgi:hypothetical protein
VTGGSVPLPRGEINLKPPSFVRRRFAFFTCRRPQEGVVMVTFLSFFSSKKNTIKLKSPSSTPNLETSTSSAPAVRPRPVQRFLSLRPKPKTRPYDLGKKRASTEIQGKRSSRQSTVAPRLDLAFEVRAQDEGKGNAYSEGFAGLRFDENVVVSPEEVQALEGMRFGLEDMRLAWLWFGKALKDTGRWRSAYTSMGLRDVHRP